MSIDYAQDPKTGEWFASEDNADWIEVNEFRKIKSVEGKRSSVAAVSGFVDRIRAAGDAVTGGLIPENQISEVIKNAAIGFSETNPTAVSVGEGVGTGVLAAGGGAAGRAVALARGARPFAAGAAELLAGGAGGALGDDEFLSSFGGGVAQDVGTIGAFSAAGAVTGMVGRVASNIARIGRAFGKVPDTRAVSPGDFGDESAGIISRFQDRPGTALTPGQASGSRADLSLEDQFRSDIDRGGELRDVAQQNQQVLNQDAAESVGLARDTPLVAGNLDQAGQDIQSNIDELVNRAPEIPVTDDIINRFRSMAESPRVLEQSTIRSLNLRADQLEVFKNESGVLPQGFYQELRKDLVADMMSASKSQVRDADAELLQSAVEALDELPVLAISQDPNVPNVFAERFIDDFGREREKARNLIALTRGKAVDDNGMVRPLTLRSNLEKVFAGGGSFRLDKFASNPETLQLRESVKVLTNPRMQFGGNSLTASRLQPDIEVGKNIAGAQALAGAASGDPLALGTLALQSAARGKARLDPRLHMRGGVTPAGDPGSSSFGLGVGAGTLDFLSNLFE